MKKNKNLILFIVMFIELLIIPLFIDIYTRRMINLEIYNFNNVTNRITFLGFTFSWILIILLLIYLVKEKKRVKVFNILCIGLNILLFSEISYARQMGKFLTFSDLFLAGEGLQYIESCFVSLNFGMVITILIGIFFMILLCYLDKKIPSIKENKKNKKIIVFFFLVFIINFRVFSLILLGNEDTSDAWKENYNARNIYNNFNNPNTSMFLTGFYEYHVRNVYKYFYNLITLDKEVLKTNVDQYNHIYGKLNTDNEMTGIFEDKSVIMIMMESIDSWIIDENTMPTLYYLQNTGLNFTNKYSPFFNGGQTINSEFALNTGMYAISNKKTIYDINDVDYKYSLANMLKKNGYKVNSFHANTGSFYNRSNFHKLLGYDYHYSAMDLQKDGLLTKSKNYFVDSEFIKDDTLFDLFVDDDKFLSFFTTYSAHLPYTSDNKVYRFLQNDNIDYNESEEQIYRTQAKDTDLFLNILINKLKASGKIDDVVIVLCTDHYSYGYTDTDFVAFKKGVKNDPKYLQNTPLIIWSNDIEHKDINTILDTADVLPTLLNMLNIDYDSNMYLGDDVFSADHDDFVWFSDGTYINQNSTLSEEAILTKINYNIKKNRAILLTNYYGK